MKVITQGAQFGRIVQVEIRNYTTQQKFFIDNNLRIDFTFFKTIDQVTEASLGQVKIYGLTQQTFSEMNSTGGELELKFGYKGTEVQTLFIATITSMHPENSQDGLCAVINVSANYADYMYTKSLIQAGKDQTLMSVLSDIREQSQGYFKGATIILDTVPLEHQDVVATFVTEARVSFSSHGNLGQVVRDYAKKFAMELFRDEDGFLYARFPAPNVPAIVEFASKPYQKANFILPESSEDNVKLIKDLEQDPSDETAFILNQYTGLLGYPKEEYKLLSVPANWNVAASEQVTRKGQETIMTNAQKKKEADAKYAEKVQKATEKGKLNKLKPQKKTRQANIQIKRKYLRVNALLNPAIRPQTQINIQSNLNVYSGIYRVRTATYQGTNSSGSCSMELYCEDSSRKTDTQTTDQDIRNLGDQMLEGGVGDQLEGDGVTSGATEE